MLGALDFCSLVISGYYSRVDFIYGGGGGGE